MHQITNHTLFSFVHTNMNNIINHVYPWLETDRLPQLIRKIFERLCSHTLWLSNNSRLSLIRILTDPRMKWNIC